jgi:hypothetical protein
MNFQNFSWFSGISKIFLNFHEFLNFLFSGSWLDLVRDKKKMISHVSILNKNKKKNPGDGLRLSYTARMRCEYGAFTAVYGQIRAVYMPYFCRNPGRWFTAVLVPYRIQRVYG